MCNYYTIKLITVLKPFMTNVKKKLTQIYL